MLAGAPLQSGGGCLMLGRGSGRYSCIDLPAGGAMRDALRVEALISAELEGRGALVGSGGRGARC